MKNYRFIHIVVVGVFLVLLEQLSGLNTVSALSLNGPPRSILQPEQNSFAVELGYSQMDLESYGEVKQTFNSIPLDPQYGKYNIDKIKSITPSVRFDTNITENWDIFLRLGATDASSDISEENAGGYSSAQLKDFDGDFGFSYGIGTRTTFYEQDNTTWGATFQANWINPGESDITDSTDINFSGTAELKYWEIQIAVGPTVNFDNYVRVYGGPFLQFIKGSLDINGSTIDINTSLPMTLNAETDIREKTQLGGFIGAQWNLGNNSTLITEAQFTGDAVGAGISMAWKF